MVLDDQVEAQEGVVIKLVVKALKHIREGGLDESTPQFPLLIQNNHM